MAPGGPRLHQQLRCGDRDEQAALERLARQADQDLFPLVLPDRDLNQPETDRSRVTGSSLVTNRTGAKSENRSPSAWTPSTDNSELNCPGNTLQRRFASK